MVDPSRHSRQRGALESLVRDISGFKGYFEKEYRRESDELTRRAIAENVRRAKQSLDNHLQTLVKATRLDELSACESLRTRLDRLESKLRSAVRGYSGLFDFVRVDEKLLDEVYDHDLALWEESQSLPAAFDKLGTAEETPASLTAKVDALEKRFDQRGALLAGIGE